MKKGIFITLEGPDGSGKSTQIQLLSEYLTEKGYDIVLTREPGGTAISEEIRKVILNPELKEMTDMTELLLYASARAQLVGELIKPALEQGKAVISDRFIDSSAVYQGIGRGLGIETVYEVNSYALQGLMPNITFLLDLDAEEGIKRKKKQAELDRMEQQDVAFHQKVANGYREIAKRNPERIIKLDGTLPREVICDMIRKKVEEVLRVL